MAELAIKGHTTRGKEVIQVLEMLGGVNKHQIDAIRQTYVYFIDIDNIIRLLQINQLIPEKDIVYSLEEFLEKYPYKVGDKVCYQPNLQIDTICISEIISMKWADNSVIYFTSNGYSLYACDLQPYKEEIIEEGTNKAVFEGNAQSCDIMNDIIKEEAMEEKGTLVQIDFTRELRIADEVEVILGDYEFVLKDGKTYFVKKNKYPKTYEECCEVLGIGSYFEPEIRNATTEECHKFMTFMKLKRCRDAYWKVAGEQMGLGKPWEPDWDNLSTPHEFIKIHKGYFIYSSRVLVFPTPEMRDAFYENFKDLIESCKELL